MKRFKSRETKRGNARKHCRLQYAFSRGKDSTAVRRELMSSNHPAPTLRQLRFCPVMVLTNNPKLQPCPAMKACFID